MGAVPGQYVKWCPPDPTVKPFWKEARRIKDELKQEKTQAQDLEEESTKKRIAELEGMLQGAKMEARVKSDLVKKRKQEAGEIIVRKLREVHKKEVVELAGHLARAAEVNQRVKDIQDRWPRSIRGSLPNLFWPELLPGGGPAGVSKYSTWLKELKAHGYC